MTVGAWRRALGCAALLLAAPGASALSLGGIDVRSAAGAPLEARIAIRNPAREALSGSCFALLPDARGAALPGGSLELRRHARGAELLVRTRDALREAPPAFAVAVGCRGARQRVDFALQLPGVSARAVPAVAHLAARQGESLASIAHAIFRDDSAVRARYLAELRRENPALASTGDEEPLAPGASVALPDLHAFAATIPAHRAPPSRHAAAVAPLRAPAPIVAVPRPLPAPPAPPAQSVAGLQARFELRLSAPVLDLSPSKAMDERRRAQLRERLLVLEADDRTSAMLAMRDDIRRLESQVKALQLKLASIAAMPEPSARPEVQATPDTPAPQPVMEATAKAPVAPAPSPAVSPPKKEAAPRQPRVVARAEGGQAWDVNPWWIAALAAILALAFALRRLRGRREADQSEADQSELSALEEDPAQHATMPEAPDSHAPDTEAPEPGMPERDEPIEPDGAPLAEAAPAVTRIPAEDNAELSRRYMKERFPEIANGALALEDARSIVQAARLLYDDGAAPRAIELLHFAIEHDPRAMAPWLALFDIFRRERLAGEYAALAARFQAQHGAADEWRKVRSVGRSIDPDHPLYEGAEFGLADPDAEGWLRQPGGDAPHPLAARLRGRLMAQAGVAEEDLRADPTPALRKAESFSVA